MFEWAVGNVKGRSITISGQNGSIELKPITQEFLEKIPNVVPLSKDEHEVVDALLENIGNLRFNGYELISCETYDRYSALFDKFYVGYEIFEIEAKSNKPCKFQFYADNEITLAAYSLAFQIALGIGQIIDVSHYYGKKKVVDLQAHESNKALLTIITMDNRQQIAICPTSDGLELLIGNMSLHKEGMVFDYGYYSDLISWVYNPLYGRYDLVHNEYWGSYEEVN